ncbi:hypothetical protein ACTJLD_21545 [Burkholderia sp. 22088]|uniref:hypothetical protein n=1 Tax=Burkholderia sp. 22088 TaxID=3453871 RepID=UPI003F824AF6
MSHFRTEQIGRFSVDIRVYQPKPEFPTCKWVFEFTPTDENGNRFGTTNYREASFDTPEEAFAEARRLFSASFR